MKLTYDHSGLSRDEIEQTGQRLQEYIDRLHQVIYSHAYSEYESSINLPSDEDLHSQSINLKNTIDTSRVKYIIDIGIGGSNLGTKAIYDSMFGFFDTIEPERFPKMFFFDTINSAQLKKTFDFLNSHVTNPAEVLIVLISKSGGTTETIANFELLRSYAPPVFAPELSNVVAITDEGSALWNRAQEKGIRTLPIPKPVGGRYSVFSPVGIFPLEVVGVNTYEIFQGAQMMRDMCVSKDIWQNPALISAVTQYLQFQRGKTIHDTFIFQSNVESIGKWYRQLMGESIGKEMDKDNNVVHTGITPNLSIGSTDLHSVGQLYLGGPKDKMTEFVFSSMHNDTLTLPSSFLMDGLVDHIESKTTEDILNAILQGTMIAYQNKELPFVTVDLEGISLKSIGGFMQFKMIEMMYIGYLLNVNTFDQPNVESYKIETKRILAQS